MSPLSNWRQWRGRVVLGASAVALLSLSTAASSTESAVDAAADRQKTATPIKHVIVLIGENRTFDHVFATYVPKSRDHVKNLLSEGIVNADGTPGPNFAKAAQFQATPPFQTKYFISLNAQQKAPYKILPEPTLNFAPTQQTFPPGTPATLLAAVEPSLDADDLNLLTTGAATQFAQTSELPDPDTRVQNFNTLPNGPFPLRGAADRAYQGRHRLLCRNRQRHAAVGLLRQARRSPRRPSGVIEARSLRRHGRKHHGSSERQARAHGRDRVHDHLR
jgi:hypothetical protein